MQTAIMLDQTILSPDRVRGLRRNEFVRLAEAGEFDDEHVELLRGELVVMSRPSAAHVNVTAQIAMTLSRQIGSDLRVLSQSGLSLWDDSWPQPDVAVVPSGPLDRHAASALLAVEVADTSLRKDTTIKTALYAETIPVYWVVDLVHREVLVYSQPHAGHYRRLERLQPGDVLTLDGQPDVSVPVAAIVPPA